MKYKLFFAALVVAFFPWKVHAEWVTTNLDRVQALPNGNINFWLTSNSADCGSHSTPFKVVLGQYGINESGLNSLKSFLLSAIATGKQLHVSVRDEQCLVDSVTLIQ